MKEKFKNFVSKINMKYLFVVIPLILIAFLIVLSSIFGIVKEYRDQDEKYKTVVFKTKDNKVSLTFNKTFEAQEVGEYDLYVKDENRQLITGIFTYNLSEYEENSAVEILNSQVGYFKKTRNDMKIYKDETTKDYDDKTITMIEYSGKSTDSSDCVYIFSVIAFKNNPDYVVYSNQVLLKNNYEKYADELRKIVISAKLE